MMWMNRRLLSPLDETRCGAGSGDPIATCSDAAPHREAPLEPPVLTAHHALTLLPGMESLLGSIVHNVEQARTRVAVETYIYRDDKLGRAFADALARAAARGVRTRLLYDPLGSQETPATFFDELRDRGIDVRAYRPLPVVLGTGAFAPRDHSRVIVIDDSAYTGGAAWGDEWLPKLRGGRGWHDVCVRVEGPCVEDFAHVFEQRWREANAELETPRDVTTASHDADVELVADTPDSTIRVFSRYREAIQRATSRVWIENAYFFPPADMLDDLYEAAARGVDVQIILPGETDLPIMQRAARAEHAEWMDQGIKIFEYQPCILHSKFALVDDDWCTIGTFNANPTSVVWVNEVNLFITHAAFVARVARLFAHDREACREVTREALAALPLVDKAVDQLANGLMSTLDMLTRTSSG